jgi:drug/metabolite transporter (DMT)-like permease
MAGSDYGRGVVMVLAAGLLWSLIGLGIRLIEQAGAWQVMLWRSLGMTPVLMLWIALGTGGHPLRALRATGTAGLIGGLGLVAAFAGSIIALQATTVANAVFLFAAAPLLTALLAWPVLREPVRRATWIAIALAALGILVMVREGLALGAGLGNAAALVSAAGFAVFTLALRRGRLSDMLPAVALGGLLSIAAGAAVLILTGQPVLIDARDAAIAAAIGVLFLGGGMVLYTAGSRSVPAAELPLLGMLEVMLAPVWVWLTLGERASAGTLAGGSILLLALALNALSGVRHRPPPPAA